jgi:hypothetical protein
VKVEAKTFDGLGPDVFFEKERNGYDEKVIRAKFPVGIIDFRSAVQAVLVPAMCDPYRMIK